MIRMSRLCPLTLGALFTAVSAFAAAPAIPDAVARTGAAHITRDTLRAPIRILASDEFEGRGPATRGDALARLYLSTELETLVNSGRFAVAFSLYPVSVSDLMQVCDAGGIMPPKSTWFEPKLRDGLLSHLI